MLHFSVNIDKSEISVLFLNSLIQLFSLFISVCTLLLYVSIKIDIYVKSIGTSHPARHLQHYPHPETWTLQGSIHLFINLHIILVGYSSMPLHMLHLDRPESVMKPDDACIYYKPR